MNEFEQQKCQEMRKAAKPTKSPDNIKLIRTSIVEEFNREPFAQIEELCIKTTEDFIEFFKSLPDKRRQDRVKYDVASLTVLIFFSILAGYYNCVEIAFYIKKNKKLFIKMGLLVDTSPSHDTIRTILSLYDSVALCNAFRVIFRDFLRYFAETGEIICVDGKYMNATDRNGNTCNCGSLNFYDANGKIPFAQYPIKEKESEMKLVQDVLPDINIANKIICADALHAQTKTTKLITDGKGYYLISLKDNQKNLHQDVTLYIDDIIKTAQLKKYSICRYKTRFIEKEIFVFDAGILPLLKERFSGITYFILFRKTNTKTKVVEDLHLITSIDKKVKIIRGIKKRWSAENDLHRHKDMIFDEDKYQTANSATANNIAIFNSFALSLVRMVQPVIEAPSLKIARKYLQSNLIECLTESIKKYGINRIATTIASVKSKKK